MISEPVVAVEDDHPSLVSEGSQLVLLVSDVLEGHQPPLVQDGVVVPEALRIGQRGVVVVLHLHQRFLHAHYITQSLPLNA